MISAGAPAQAQGWLGMLSKGVDAVNQLQNSKASQGQKQDQTASDQSANGNKNKQADDSECANTEQGQRAAKQKPCKKQEAEQTRR